MSCSELQLVAVCCSVLHHDAGKENHGRTRLKGWISHISTPNTRNTVSCSELQCIAVCWHYHTGKECHGRVRLENVTLAPNTLVLCVKTRRLHESPGLVIIYFVRLPSCTLPFVFSGETVRLCMWARESPNLRLRSRLELWSRSWHGWFLEQSF